MFYLKCREKYSVESKCSQSKETEISALMGSLKTNEQMDSINLVHGYR